METFKNFKRLFSNMILNESVKEAMKEDDYGHFYNIDYPLTGINYYAQMAIYEFGFKDWLIRIRGYDIETLSKFENYLTDDYFIEFLGYLKKCQKKVILDRNLKKDFILKKINGVSDTENQPTTDKKPPPVEKNEIKSFSEYLSCDEKIKNELIEYLKQTFVGKGGKGKMFATLVCALEKADLINYTDISKLYHSIKSQFGEIGGKRGFEKYLCRQGLNELSRKTLYTNKLTHSDIDWHVAKINEMISKLKSSQ